MQAFDSRLSRRTALLGTAGAALQLCWPVARAADPTLRALVGFPPGGAIDTTARVYADALKNMGTILVENRPGAAGNIAGTALAQSKPDGSTLMFAPVNVYCISPALYKALPFEPARDFAPVGVVATFPWALAVHPSVPANSLAEFIAWVKAKPEPALCGMAAIGSEGHLMAYSFAKTAGIPMQFVAYKGGAPMAQDLMAGHIQMAFDPIVNMGPPHKAGKVKVLAVTGTTRTPTLPDIPTFRELGHPSITGETWIGASMRQGTAATSVQSFADALAAAARTPAVRDRLAAVGLTAQSRSPTEMAALIASDTAEYGKLVRELDLKLE
jgi:tripartite-type tricarboxylate transporter receptor subunit TctC